MTQRKAIGFHFTHLSVDMTSAGTLWPNVFQVESEAAALEMAKKEVTSAADLMECCVGVLTVFDDGTVQHSEYTQDDLGLPDEGDDD